LLRSTRLLVLIKRALRQSLFNVSLTAFAVFCALIPDKLFGFFTVILRIM